MALDDVPKPSHEVYQSIEHANQYDVMATYCSAVLRTYYSSFNDVIQLRKILNVTPKRRVLELGCASGELCRLIGIEYPEATYMGRDISHPAIELAKNKYPNSDFDCISSKLAALDNIKPRPDILFAKDVVVHQPNALLWLEHALLIPKEFAILRMRVRKSGQTELDPRKSFQEYFGGRAPWIVISVEDIKNLSMKIPNVKSVNLIFSQPSNFANNGGRTLPVDLTDSSVETCSAVLVLEKSNKVEITPSFQTEEIVEPPFKMSIQNKIRQKWFKLMQILNHGAI